MPFGQGYLSTNFPKGHFIAVLVNSIYSQWWERMSNADTQAEVDRLEAMVTISAPVVTPHPTDPANFEVHTTTYGLVDADTGLTATFAVPTAVYIGPILDP